MNKRTSRVLRLPFKLRVFELFDGRLNERPVVLRYLFVGHPSRPVITIIANEADAWPAALPYGMHIDAEEMASAAIAIMIRRTVSCTRGSLAIAVFLEVVALTPAFPDTDAHNARPFASCC